jgi:hypothetical protein
VPALRHPTQFFVDTQVELLHPRPHGFPASGIWGYRIANVALNLLNYFWFSKIASKAVQLLSFQGSQQRGGGSNGSRLKQQ